MTDLDPEIWENPTLGKAAQNERLDRIERQQHEDRSAKIEGREPREVVVENDYPGWTPPVAERTGTVPSYVNVVHFADEQPNDVQQTYEDKKPEGMSDEEWNAIERGEIAPVDPYAEENSNEPEVSDSTEEVESSEAPVSSEDVESESAELDSAEESDSQKWT